MKSKPLPVGSRHPKVVMIVDNEEDTTGAANILVSHIDEYRTIQLNEDTTSYLLQTEPSVILFALSNVEKCVEYYKCLVDEHQMSHSHYSVILCNNKESSLAFRCCMKSFFDNYFVYQPLYETLRLLMVVQNGLISTKSDSMIKNENDELFEQIDDELSQLIEEGSRCKQSLLQKITKKRQEITQLTSTKTTNTESDEANDVLNDSTMMSITEEHITPLLAHLENDIRVGLDDLLAKLLSKKTNFESPPPAKQNKRKGLITHVASIKKRPLPEDDDELPPIVKDEPHSSTNLTEDGLLESSNASILIVEDNNLYRDMIAAVLSKEKYQVDEAEDGLCALQKIKDKHYDLILMDLFMPNLDGLNATKKIRQLSGGRDIPVIALTGNKNKEIVKKWAHYGLKGYIMKPSTKNEILSMVKKTLHPNDEASAM
jgi:CheY-like chemotaxis protein